MIRVVVDEVLVSQTDSGMSFIVLLRESKGSRVLPIHIAQAEAQAIAMHIEGGRPPRPMTHDLFATTIHKLGHRILRVEISDLHDGIFFAAIILTDGVEEIRLDCRPSDGIALALRSKARLFVEEHVMDMAGTVVREVAKPPAAPPPSALPARQPQPPHVDSPLDVLQSRLESFIREEKYEEAARIRDEIRRISSDDKSRA